MRTLNTTASISATRKVPGVRNAVAVIVAFVMAVLLSVSLSATPASAHDELAGSNPEDGATVAQVPDQIELTFSNVPSAIGSQVQVLDSANEDWAEGDVQITDTVASQAVRSGAPAGQYTVNWRIVSSDAHPIEGSFAFTAEAAGGAAGGETGGAAGGGAAGAEATPDSSAGTAGPLETVEPDALESEAASEQNFPWSIVIMVIVLVVLAAVLAVTARRRLKQGSSG